MTNMINDTKVILNVEELPDMIRNTQSYLFKLYRAQGYEPKIDLKFVGRANMRSKKKFQASRIKRRPNVARGG